MRLYVDVAGDLVEVLTGKSTHNYHGKLVPGDLKQRTQVEYDHKIRLDWAKKWAIPDYFHKRAC